MKYTTYGSVRGMGPDGRGVRIRSEEGRNMITSTYHVFGSGGAGITRFYRDGMTARQVLDALDSIREKSGDDGNNGFIGTRSLSRAICEDAGILSFAWFHPGPSEAVETLPGYRHLAWRRDQIRAALADGGDPDGEPNAVVDAFVRSRTVERTGPGQTGIDAAQL